MTGSDVCLSVAEHLLSGVRLSRELFPPISKFGMRHQPGSLSDYNENPQVNTL